MINVKKILKNYLLFYLVIGLAFFIIISDVVDILSIACLSVYFLFQTNFIDVLELLNISNLFGYLTFFGFFVSIAITMFTFSTVLSCIFFVFKLEKVCDVMHALQNLLLFAPTILFLFRSNPVLEKLAFMLFICTNMMNFTMVSHKLLKETCGDELNTITQYTNSYRKIILMLRNIIKKHLKSSLQIYLTELVDDSYLINFFMKNNFIFLVLDNILDDDFHNYQYSCAYIVIQLTLYILGFVLRREN